MDELHDAAKVVLDFSLLSGLGPSGGGRDGLFSLGTNPDCTRDQPGLYNIGNVRKLTKDLKHGSLQLVCHGAGSHDASDLEESIEGDVSVVLH